MILVDHQIRQAVADDELGIVRFADDSVQPASYDLRIGPLVYEPTKPEQPYDMSANGGAYRLPPYGNVVLETFEDLKLPNQMIGRIALKSGFARRGMIASVGPQIDPGFEGKLFVTLFNMTAASHILEFRDTFLTIEFHTLDAKPQETYSGPYQGKYTVGAEIMDALARLEGLTLSEMQQQFTALARSIKEWSAFATRVDDFLADMRAQTEAISKLTRTLEEGGPTNGKRVVEARKLSTKQAADEVLKLFRERGRLYFSDIAEALSLDMATVISATEELRRRGLIEQDDGKKTAKRARN